MMMMMMMMMMMIMMKNRIGAYVGNDDVEGYVTGSNAYYPITLRRLHHRNGYGCFVCWGLLDSKNLFLAHELQIAACNICPLNVIVYQVQTTSLSQLWIAHIMVVHMQKQTVPVKLSVMENVVLFLQADVLGKIILRLTAVLNVKKTTQYSESYFQQIL